MDNHNRFETRTTMLLMRMEWTAALVAVTALALAHVSEIRWAVFIGFFVIIDVIGYLPGAVAFRRSPDGRIHRGYYVAYNTMHSLLTGAAMIGIWAVLFGPEWALLAVPIHLFGDRALFGNTLKPFRVSFEPRAHPAFVRFERAFRTDDPAAAAPDRSREVADAVRP